MNTLYGRQAQPETDHVVKNITQFCYVGADDSFPKGCLPLGSTGVVVPPGRAVKKHGGLLPHVLRNSFDFKFLLSGPKAGAATELDALRARGVQVVSDVKEFKVGEVEHISAELKGVHLVLEDVTSQTTSVQKELLDDPNMIENLHKLSTELDHVRARAEKAEAELAALKAERAKTIPARK